MLVGKVVMFSFVFWEMSMLKWIWVGRETRGVFVDRAHQRNLLVRPKDISNNNKNILLYV
jgi:hypothetical protein